MELAVGEGEGWATAGTKVPPTVEIGGNSSAGLWDRMLLKHPEASAGNWRNASEEQKLGEDEGNRIRRGEQQALHCISSC